MRFSDFSIAWRVGFAVALPMAGLLLFIALFVKTEFDEAERLNRVSHYTQFSRDVSGLVHELQRERGNSAGYIGARGQGEFPARLQAQRDATDQAMAVYYRAVDALPDSLHTQYVDRDLQEVARLLTNLTRHRENVWNLQTNMGQTVTPYTQTINGLINLLADEVHSLSGGASIEPLIGMLALMHAKENAGIERAVGSNSFSSGTVTNANHRRALTLAAKQSAYFEEFRELMPDEWDQRLDLLQNQPEVTAVLEAREVLIEGGYGAPVEAFTGPQWFDLTTQRIDLLMGLESELTEELIVTSKEMLSDRRQNTFIYMVLGIITLLGTAAVSVAMTLSVVRPLANATRSLTRLAEGDTNIVITGDDRQDELGDMARATLAFLQSAREREIAQQRLQDVERAALEERTRLLTEMSHQIKHATETSVGGVASMAENLRTKSSEVRNNLMQAGNDAQSAEASANQSLDQADRAADLATELSHAISEVTEQVTHGDAMAREAVSKAAASRQEVEDLQAAANQISDFVSIISGLAEQTNLLALNATIESARAGEAGKGFAVVASEVKSLAEQTNKSANEISERVQQIQARTGDAAQAISNIADSIDGLGEVTAAVAAAMEEQRASAGSFAQFVEDNRSALTQVSSQIKSMAEIAQRSASDSDTMSDLVLEMAQVAEEANVSIPAIVNQSIDKAQSAA